MEAKNRLTVVHFAVVLFFNGDDLERKWKNFGKCFHIRIDLHYFQ